MLLGPSNGTHFGKWCIDPSVHDRECGRYEVRALELIIISRCIDCFLLACTTTDMASFLEELPRTIKKYPYNGEKQFLEIFDQAYDNLRNGTPDASEYLLFEIDQETFSRDFLHTDSDISRFWTSYDASQQLLLIQIGTLEHSQATAFNHSLVAALEPMGLHMALQTYSGVTIIVDSTGSCKQGDHGWGPIRPPPGRSRKWPTVVLEGEIGRAHV